MTAGAQNVRERCSYRLIFWNVENAFDIWDDPSHDDDEFTPRGKNGWTRQRYDDKLGKLGKTIIAMGSRDSGEFEMPLLVGMAEVENAKVLRDLCSGTMIRKYGYDFVHFESADRRGIDNALLYRKELYRPFLTKAINVSDSVRGFFTRDLLLVEGITAAGDTLIVVVCHFPSRRGGSSADRRRSSVARHLRETMDTLATVHPRAAVVVMGDFNTTPDDAKVERILLGGEGRGGEFVNLMSGKEEGSYKFRGRWSCLDQIIVLRRMVEGLVPLRVDGTEGRIFNAGFLLVDDEKDMGYKPQRTYSGPRYEGGVSDHLPVFVDLKRVE